ncbi:MAG: F-type H+-transporting ATPase subunit delta [Gammaproteobacteria bacterium]|jgi:F-type H+-transporting ATPase subunit delta
MQDKTTIARPYARAVFETASEEGNLKEWSEMLGLLETVVTDSQMKAVLSNPKMNAEALTDFILGVCGDALSETGSNLVKVLADARRLSFIPELNKLYEQQRAEAEGVIEVGVSSAYELTSEQQATISTAMAKRLGRKVAITSDIDESLIGGMVIRAGDSVIDASIKGRLKALATQMIN